jgi:hypothetical protein
MASERQRSPRTPSPTCHADETKPISTRLTGWVLPSENYSHPWLARGENFLFDTTLNFGSLFNIG